MQAHKQLRLLKHYPLKLIIGLIQFNKMKDFFKLKLSFEKMECK